MTGDQVMPPTAQVVGKMAAWALRAPGKIAVVAVLYDQSQNPIAQWRECLRAEDLSAAYLVFPESVPKLMHLHDGEHSWADPLGGVRCKSVLSDELLRTQGCLCCDLRSELGVVLSQLFMRILTRIEPKVSVVFVMTRATQVDALAQMLRHAPFLAQRFVLSGQMDLN